MANNNSKGILEKTFSFNYAAGIAAVALVLGVILSYGVLPATGLVVLPSGDAATAAADAIATCDATPGISEEGLKANVEAYLNDYLALSGAEGVSVKITGLSEHSDSLYSVSLEFYENGELAQESELFATKDGKYIITGLMDLAEELPEPAAADAAADAAPELAQAERPTVKMFVMAFCPYGQQAENGLGPALEALGDTVEFEPHYIVSACDSDSSYNGYCSMHGAYEAEEDARQLCIFNSNPGKFWEYVNYVNANCSKSNLGTCWKDAAEAAGLNVSAIESCMSKDATSLLEAEAKLSEDLGISSSPTILLNGSKYSGARSADAFKTGICEAYLEQPGACGAALDNSTAATTGGCG